MLQEKLNTLSRIYNTLLLVHTNGEDTIIMGDCLKTLRMFIENEQEDLNKEE